MEELKEKKSFINRINLYIRNNLRLIIGLVIIILLVLASIEYYKFYEEKKIKDISINYFQAIENLYSEEENSIQLFNEVSKLNSGYAIMSSMKLIENSLTKKDYYNAYYQYETLLNKLELNQKYKDLIIINASYNLIGHINYEDINSLLKKTDVDKSSFKSYFYEIKYINSIEILNKEELNNLNNYIQNDIEIIFNVKGRINKLNEYMQYR